MVFFHVDTVHVSCATSTAHFTLDSISVMRIGEEGQHPLYTMCIFLVCNVVYWPVH
jgi:hypothetical protein